MAEPGPLHADLARRFGTAVGAGTVDPPVEVVALAKGVLVEAVAWLKAERGFDALMDLTAVDYAGAVSLAKPARFEVVYALAALGSRAAGAGPGPRLRLKVAVTEEDPAVPTLTPLFASANWLERECWDLFGIRFAGHPDLRRLLLYDEFAGHPLRKDYALMHQQPRVAQVFPGAPPFGRRPDVLKDPEGA